MTQANDRGDTPDLSFYTELRYPGDAEDIIRAYATALRRLVDRQANDLRSGGRGEFGGLSEPLLIPLAEGLEGIHDL